jgi:ankyrin repeat protein
MLCAANTPLVDQLEVESWTSEHFEAYVQYLNKRPFLTYALSYLKKHLHKCDQVIGVSRLVSQLREKLAEGPAAYIFQQWDPCGWGQLVATNQEQDKAKRFRLTLLHTATRMKYSQVVEVLLIAGADVESYLDGKTPLLVSAEGGDLVTARLLLDQGAFIDAQGSKKRTALHLAAANGHNPVAGLLIDRGADKEAKDDRGQTALHLAAANGHNSVIELLIDRGAHKKATDVFGWGALHTAAWNGHEATIQMLIQTFDANREERDKFGWTALHVAAISGRDAAIRLLIENLGADKEAKDDIGWTALHLAAAAGLGETSRLLIETLTVNRNARNKEEDTALDLAEKL